MRRFRILIAFAIAMAGQAAAGSPFTPVSVKPALPAGGSGKPGPGMFLVARRALVDPNFGQSVVYLVEHDAQGTLGLIVNRSSHLDLAAALPDIENEQAATHALRFGGPVSVTVITMLLRGESLTRGMAHVADDVYISSDRSVLDDVLAAQKSAGEVRFYLGYSGWAAGQLDFELESGSWHVVPADSDAIFARDTDSLWYELIERLEPEGIQVQPRDSRQKLVFAARPVRPEN